MITRRTFASAATLFPLLTACGGDPNYTGVGTAENPGPGIRHPEGPGLGIPRFTAAANNGFLLDSKPFFMAAGELHPGRIPYQYWNQRIQMVKSMGFNTVSIYDFWSMHERNFDPATGPQFDFTTAENNLPLFIDLCKQNNMWVFLRPGPFVDAFWDLGGIPGYLLKNDGIVLRSSTDANYMAGVARYVAALAPLILPRLSSNGGPIIMVQVENEYTSFARDNKYVKAVRTLWQNNGVGVGGNVLLSTNNGLDKGTVVNSDWGLVDQPIGGDPIYLGDSAKGYALYHQPMFGAENYSGWDSLSSSSTMYGDSALSNAEGMARDIQGLLQEQTSFSIYVACGGTSFEYGASGNYDDITTYTYDTNVTSYDYRGPINEQGSRAVNLQDASGNVTTSSYDTTRAVFATALQLAGTPYSLKGPLDAAGAVGASAIPAAPPAIPMIALAASAMPLTSYASIWDNLPAGFSSSVPLACEKLGMYAGVGIVYQTTTPLVSGVQYLILERLADVATVFLNGQMVAIVDRRPQPGIPLGTTNTNTSSSVVKMDFGLTPQNALIELFVYTFGHTHKEFTGKRADSFRKGLWGRTFLFSEFTPAGVQTNLGNWRMRPLPMTPADIAALKPISNQNLNRPGKFFASTFSLQTVGDAYLDLSTWNLGAVWVNGHNLGRHSAAVGPQTRWYCPGAWLKQGSNQLIIFDNYITRVQDMRVALLNTPSVYQDYVINSGNTYTITGVFSGKRLGTAQGNSVAGTLLAIAPATGGTEQQWVVSNVGGRWQLMNVKSGLLMDVPGGLIAEGTALDIAAATNTANQTFNLLGRPDAHSFGIKGQQSGLVVSDGSAGLGNPTAITLAPDLANPNQSWTFALA